MTAAISGTFQNINADTTKPSIWDVLTKNYKVPEFGNNYKIAHSTVRLTAMNKKRVLAELFSDTGLIEQKIIKGKVKGDYFRSRRKMKYFGLPLIFLSFAAGHNEHYSFVFDQR